jgi:hypothetical protein
MQIGGQEILIGLAVIGGGLGLLSYFKKQYTPKEMADVLRRLTVIETKIELYWGAVEKQMSSMLHSPHRSSLDVLLDKNARDERLTYDEAIALVDLLQKLIDSKELSGNEEAGARMLIAVTIGKYALAI